jgi:hypothetical protein
MLFLRRFVVEECLVSMNNKMLADVYDMYDISVGNVKKFVALPLGGANAEVSRVRCPLTRSSEQEAEIVDRWMYDASEGKVVTKRELRNEVEERDRKIPTYGWVNRFVAQHHDAITDGKARPQENT